MDWSYRQSVVDNGKIHRIQKEKGCTYQKATELLREYRKKVK